MFRVRWSVTRGQIVPQSDDNSEQKNPLQKRINVGAPTAKRALARGLPDGVRCRTPV